MLPSAVPVPHPPTQVVCPEKRNQILYRAVLLKILKLAKAFAAMGPEQSHEVLEEESASIFDRFESILKLSDLVLKLAKRSQ